MDYYERQQDRIDNGREPQPVCEDYAYGQHLQRELDDPFRAACRAYEKAVWIEAEGRKITRGLQ